jgi:hypothetical protein
MGFWSGICANMKWDSILVLIDVISPRSDVLYPYTYPDSHLVEPRYPHNIGWYNQSVTFCLLLLHLATSVARNNFATYAGMQQLVQDQMVYCYFVVEEMQPVWYVIRICTRLHILICDVVWKCHDKILVLIQWQIVQPHKLTPNHDLNCGCQIYEWLSDIVAQKRPLYFFLNYYRIWTINYDNDEIWLLWEYLFVLKNLYILHFVCVCAATWQCIWACKASGWKVGVGSGTWNISLSTIPACWCKPHCLQ